MSKTKTTKTNKKETLQEKGLKAAKAYLRSKGYVIVDTEWECKYGKINLISLIDDIIVFTDVETLGPDLETFPEDDIEKNRKNLEACMALYLKEHDYVDMSIRFDMMKILTLADDKALVRYHINALGVSGPMDKKPDQKE